MEKKESEVEKLIQEIRKEGEQSASEQQKRYEVMIKRLEPLVAIERKNPKTIEDVITAQLACCFRSLSYCCGSPEAPGGGKKCVFRDSVLTALGMEYKDFEEFKKQSNALLLNFLREKKIFIE